MTKAQVDTEISDTWCSGASSERPHIDLPSDFQCALNELRRAGIHLLF